MAGLDEDGESVGAQASIPDEEQTDDGLEGSAGPDRLPKPEFHLLLEPDPEGVDDAFELDKTAEICLDWLSDVCGPEFIEHTILLTTMWDKVTNSELAWEFEEKGESGNSKQSGALYSRSSNDKAGCNKIINQIFGKAPKM